VTVGSSRWTFVPGARTWPSAMSVVPFVTRPVIFTGSLRQYWSKLYWQISTSSATETAADAGALAARPEVVATAASASAVARRRDERETGMGSVRDGGMTGRTRGARPVRPGPACVLRGLVPSA